MENFESKSKERLRQLEAMGKHVFHGSGLKLDVLEPRQAYTYPNNSPEGRIPEGGPAVFASPSADVAIFMAIVNQQNCPKGLRSGFSKGGKSGFRATKETMDQVKDAIGYVYVLDKDKFTETENSNEWASKEPVKPVEIIEVFERDLPENIEIKEF